MEYIARERRWGDQRGNRNKRERIKRECGEEPQTPKAIWKKNIWNPTTVEAV